MVTLIFVMLAVIVLSSCLKSWASVFTSMTKGLEVVNKKLKEKRERDKIEAKTKAALKPIAPKKTFESFKLYRK